MSGLPDDRRGHEVAAERRPDLPEVLDVRAQHGDVAAAQPRTQHEPVEPVVLDLAAPHRRERLLEALPHVGDVQAGQGLRVQPEVVDPDRIGAGRPDLVRALVDDLRPHVLEQGQDVRERERFTVAVQLQPGRRVDGLVRPVEVDREAVTRFAGQECLEPADVAHRGAGRVVVLVCRRQRVRVPVVEQHPSFLAEPLDERVGEIVGPRPQGGGEPCLDHRRVVVGRGAGLGCRSRSAGGRRPSR